MKTLQSMFCGALLLAASCGYCALGENGISLNGISLNGISLNGTASFTNTAALVKLGQSALAKTN